MRSAWLLTLVAHAAFCVSGVRAQVPKDITPQQAQFFENQVRPIFANNCLRCHGPEKQKGKLRVDSLEGLLKGGETGAVLVPGKPEQSLFIKAINYQDLEMPPGKKLAKKDVDVLTAWVKMGAPWPGAKPGIVPTPAKQGFEITDEHRKYWAFQPVKRPPPPLGKRGPGGVASPIDAFIRQKLQSKELTLSPPAGKRDLIRRAYFDLVGLPPSPEDVERFVADSADDAYAKLLDRLLAMPQYGERWGRHWLDVVRFGQTAGYERDDEKLFSWRYRDYVITAFNEDKPYGRFILEQIAGDELDPVTDDSLIATAFFRLGVWDDEPDDARQAEFDDLDDMLSTTSNAFLGLTLGCARCHDHKFDPIGQQDYYGMLAFVRNVHPFTKPGKEADKAIFRKLSKGEKTLAVQEYGPKPRPTHILTRGSAATPGQEVGPHFVRVLCNSNEAAAATIPDPAKDAQTTGRRRVLAQWIASKDNPLTARVLVNRLWHYHFGRGIVATPSDFGKTGLAPTHPELLDWLAAELMDPSESPSPQGGRGVGVRGAVPWSIKRMHKLIMLSETYKQSSRADNEKAIAIDPGNTLLWRQNLRRLEAEAMRDSILAISGQLNLKMGGRGIFPALPKEVLSTQSMPGRGWDKSPKEEQNRRSVYIFVKRTLGVPLLETFDAASPDTSTASRNTTTIAPQALMLLNSAFMDEQASAFAERLLKDVPDNTQGQIERMFRLAMGRAPSAQEARVALDYFEKNREQGPEDVAQRHALARLCKVVLNLNEVFYVD